ncbi:MAG TPA: AMP-binding protein [Kofleriaceae bacterium]|nr:AMP-binding protein [Kofleriaceae bacterium]
MIGLKEQTVHGAASIADARAGHRWQVPADYNVAVDCLDRHIELRDKVALYYEDDEGHTEQHTFGQLIAASNRFGNALRALGIRRGDVVAVHLPQRPETAIVHLACYRIGAIALPISKLFGPEALSYRLGNSAAPVIVVEADSAHKLDGLRRDLATLRHVILVGGRGDGLAFDELLAKGSADLTMEPNTAEDPFLLTYTSGTTGNPKGVLHAHRYVLGHNGIDYSYNFLREGDLYYSPADWAWVGGLLDGLLGIWPYGIPVLAYRSKGRFDPEQTFRLQQKYGATVGLYPPTALKVLREVQRPRDRFPGLRMRCIVSGAEPVSPELARWVDQELKVEFNQGYGQTEANYFIGNCSALEAPRLEPLGKAYPGHDVAVVDAQTGQPLPVGEVGDIAIRRDDPVVMKAYWNNAEAMRDKFRGDWLLTGDNGYLDAEGYVYFQGRADDVIKSAGYRIGPAEVEASIMEHKAVASCAVIGVPDPQRGQLVKAFVKLLPGFERSEQIIGEIQRHVKDKLGAHEYPREVEFLDEFPQTVTGKIKRRELREMEERRRAGKP